MAYAINGSAVNYAPQTQQWVDVQAGVDHVGNPIFSSIKSATLGFDNVSPALAGEWITKCNTGNSVTSITLLNLDATSFVTYSNSGICLQCTRPSFESAYVTGFTVTVTGISFA